MLPWFLLIHGSSPILYNTFSALFLLNIINWLFFYTFLWNTFLFLIQYIFLVDFQAKLVQRPCIPFGKCSYSIQILYVPGRFTSIHSSSIHAQHIPSCLDNTITHALGWLASQKNLFLAAREYNITCVL